MRTRLAILMFLTAAPLSAGNPFFVNFAVQAPAAATGQDAQAAMAAGVTVMRDQVPGEWAYQVAGPDGPGPGRIYSRPSTGSYVLTDVGGQWTTAISQGQTVLAVTETYAGQYLWQGKAFCGAGQGAIAKADIVSGSLSLGPVLMAEIPAPELAVATDSAIDLSLPAFVDASGLANGLVLWRQPSGGAWEKRSDLPLSAGFQAFHDASVTSQTSYRYGLSVRYPWTGGGQGGALPLESGSYVTLARSMSDPIVAALKQPTATPFPTMTGLQPTPDLGSEAWLAYPNPNRDGLVRLAFRMVKKGSFEARFYTLDGQQIYHLSGQGDAGAWPMPVADLRKMASGIYLVRLKVTYEDGSENVQPIRKLALIR